MKILFLAWQNPDTRHWYTVGRLSKLEDEYQFTYTKAALTAHQEGGFCPLPSFPRLDNVYKSNALFPVFDNRVLATSRPDYAEFVQWLGLPEGENEPFALLARSGGQRATDTLAVFPCPEPNAQGGYSTYFFVHALSHATEAARLRVETLELGERLLLGKDIQNKYDPKALTLRTSEKYPGDMHLMGYIPRYLVDDFHLLLEQTENPFDALVITVERVNSSPAPVQFRLLCTMSIRWPNAFKPFSGSEYQPIDS